MNKVISFAVKYPITIAMMVCGVLLLGIISFNSLSIDLFPDLNNPELFIEIKAGERPPEEMEKQFVENIESMSIRQKGAVQVASICRTGTARVTVQYEWGKDMDQAFLELQRSMGRFSQNTEIEEFTISQDDPNTSPIMVVGLYHPEIDDFNEMRLTAENYIRNELVRLAGVADVQIAGDQEKEITINTDPYLLKAYELTNQQIVNKIEGVNRNVPGGNIEELGRRYVVNGVGLLEDVEDIQNIIVGQATQNATNTNAAQQQNQQAEGAKQVPILLKDVAVVEEVLKDPENIVRINGKRSLGLSIYKETKANTVNAVEELEVALADIAKALPGYEFIVIENQGAFILEAIKEVGDSGALGAFFAILILFIFFRRIGTTIIISAAIPVSIVATFNLMYFNGLTLNVMTLGGLALGAGMLVDNAIVVMENIFRKLESGASVTEAAVQGTSEVSGAITASTVTTIVVFLPIVYLHGASGELFKDQALTVAFSLVSSLVVALFMIPMFFTKVFRASKKPRKSIQFSGYDGFLKKLLAFRWIVIVMAILMLGGAWLAFNKIGSEYMPKAESKSVTMDISLPESTALNRTENTIIQIENQLRTIFGEHIQHLYSHIGTDENQEILGDNNDEGEHRAQVKLILKEESTITSAQLVKTLAQHFESMADVNVSFIQGESALNSIIDNEGAPLVVEVEGSELVTIESTLKEVEEKLKDFSGIFNLESSLDERIPQIEIRVDKQLAGMNDITSAQITTQVQEKLMGKEAGDLEVKGGQQPITIKSPKMALSELTDMEIKAGDRLLSLEQLAVIETVSKPTTVQRRNQNKIATLSGEVDDSVPFSKLVEQLETKFSEVPLAPGYKIEVTGKELQRKASMRNLSFALLLSVILVYMVLASQFESLVHPFTILLTIPLASTGAIFLFYALGMSLNVMAYIGIIMLTGIAVNDAIILVDAILKYKKAGHSVYDAIIQAGQQRIRPIIMTSLTTILALLPLTFGFGESASLRSPMALAVIGGLVSSTVLTLLVIPCVFLTFEQFITWIKPSKASA
ncbi:MAG: efflux RND transporter permease subunit [Cyclobacteriaceae bacterium]